MNPLFSPRSVVLAAFTVLVAGQGCASCQATAICSIKSRINDPENRSMRRGMMSKGIAEFCHQMTSRDAPLKLAADSPVIGRFYPNTCTQTQLPSGDIYVQFAGYGYAFTPASKKMTFTMAGSVDYNQDFLVSDECSVYAYFRARNVIGSDFRIHKIEQPIASLLNSLTPLGDNFGRQLVQGKLAEGFTVIHDASNNDDVSLGIVEKGQKPFHPFDVHGSNKITYENLRTEVHQGERDFIGPIEITEEKRALFLSAQLDGIQAADLMVMRKDDAEASLRAYFEQPVAGPLAAPPIVNDVLQAGAPYTRALPLPKGAYYVVFDNTATAGMVAPPNNPLDDRAASIGYVIQIGDQP